MTAIALQARHCLTLFDSATFPGFFDENDRPRALPLTCAVLSQTQEPRSALVR
ncbi:hypothetical protein FP2506_02749 [Fulvimarina pelagi HTCC2506]|uniref:Uncharacterized protein n=1 Tax=Fulvimarina pelagi HTCC2506 TaxID=314231 RepID=Q0G0I3_9HYPH|nr:hypothetical protein FP2506_02749 [Fulvimarina pelagi HTCC2506]